MLLRKKRTRSYQKDQHMNHFINDSISDSSHALFVYLESACVNSPTSPLDFRIFSSFCNPFRSPKLQNQGFCKSWDCSKVGLSIIDSPPLKVVSGEVIRSSDTINVLLSPQMSIKIPSVCSPVDTPPRSLPTDVAHDFPNYGANPVNIHSHVIFEIGEAPSFETSHAFSLDSERYRYTTLKSRLGSSDLVLENTVNPLKLSSIHSGTDFIGSTPTTEIELSEDYTCVRIHGPNPKVTHIFGDYIMESLSDEVTDFPKKCGDEFGTRPLDLRYDFLKFCYSCYKNLDGEDIYIYRGEKGFCSDSCRMKEILIDEQLEKSQKLNNYSSELPNVSNSCE